MALRGIARGILLTAVLGILAPWALADGVPPVTLELREQESGRFLARWRVPRMLPPTAIPTPVLPDSCRSVGERNMTERASAWFVRQGYLCPDGLAGRPIGIDFPFLNVRVSTLLRVELLSGDRYAHMLAPGESNWMIPDAGAGGARAWFREARQAVFEGAGHLLAHGVHFAFALALVLLGGLALSVRMATVFAAGQLAGVLAFSLTGVDVGLSFAEVGVAAAAVLLALQALRPREQRNPSMLLVAAAGLLHGLGLAGWLAPPPEHSGSAIVYSALVVLGTDAVLLLLALAGAGIGSLIAKRIRHPRWSTAAAYACGICAIALVLGVPVADSASASREAPAGIQLPDLSLPNGSASAPSSKRVASPFPDATLQSFITVAPFEVRHEVLVSLRGLAGVIDLDPSGELAVDDQPDVERRIHELVSRRSELTIDGRPLEPVEQRVDFLTLDTRGALPRLAPVPESIDDAWLGVTTVYVTESTPGEVTLTWSDFDHEPSVPATITDPESTRSVELTGRQPSLQWRNELSEDPTPVVHAVAVEPPVLWLPLLSVVFGLLAAGLGVAALRGERRTSMFALSRVALAGLFLVAPVGNVEIPLPFSVDRTPGTVESKQILSRLLPNVYRAFEFPTESAAYDRLALSVTGDTLTEIYLEHRRAVTMEERGGARARVEAVEVLDVAGVEPGDGAGFVTDATWTVGGTVTHFGHRHFRQNRYEARVAVLPVDGTWKIRSIEILDEKRIR